MDYFDLDLQVNKSTNQNETEKNSITYYQCTFACQPISTGIDCICMGI
ncbi:FDLD family class I lanthipeptide [Psychrobacillus sp. BM2]